MNVFELFATISLKTDDYKKELNEAEKQGEQAEKNINQRSVAMGTALGNLLSKGVAMAASYGKQAISTGVQYNAQIEKYTVALTTALGNEEKAAKAIEQIKKDAAATPYSVDSLVKANSYLISAGESAEDARSTIMALTDAISATGGGNEELSRMAQNLQQVKNVGEATSMDIRQFAMAGIDIYGILADYTGKTTSEVKDLEVSYDLLSAALQNAAAEGGRYYEANIKQSQTWDGLISTLQDNVKSKLGEALQTIQKTLQEKVIPRAIEMVQSFDATRISEALGKIIPLLLKLGDGILWVVENADELAPPIIAFGTAMGALKVVKTIAAWSKAFNGLWAIVAANPLVAIAAGVAIVGTAVYKACKDVDDLRISWEDTKEVFEQGLENGLISEEELKRAEELTDTVSDLRQRILIMKNDLDSQAAAGIADSQYQEGMDRISALEESLKGAEEELTALGEKAQGTSEEIVDAMDEGMDAIAENAQSSVVALEEVTAKYEETYNSVLKSVRGWFGAFDEAKTSVKTSVGEMMSAMQSQINFNVNYAANLQKLRDYDLPYLAEALQGLGAEGAAYAAAMVQAVEDAGGATSEGGQALIQQFNELGASVGESQESVAQSLTDISADFEQMYADAIRTSIDGVAQLDQSQAAADAAYATMDAYIKQLAASGKAVFATAAGLANAALNGLRGAPVIPSRGGRDGIQQLAVGSDYIPYDNYPALLHKGEMVVPAKISEDLRDFVGAGGQPQPQGGGMKEVVELLTAILHKNSNVYLDGRVIGEAADTYNSNLARAYG